MATKASIRQAKYDKDHCTMFCLKLNNRIDQDIMEKLATVDSKQGYIKKLIREDLARTESVPVAIQPVPVSPVPKKPKKHMSLDEIYSFLQEQADNNPEEYDGVYDLLNALTGKMMGYEPDKG